MNKIKAFSANYDSQLAKEIQSFLDCNENIEVITLSYCCKSDNSGFMFGATSIFYAMLVYKEKLIEKTKKEIS